MKLTKHIIWLAMLLLPLSGFAQKSYTIDQIPNVHLNDERRFVSNPDGVLSTSATLEIDQKLYQLKSEGKAQVVVVAVNSIGDQEPFDFLMRLMEKWGVGGKRTDNGLGILLVIDQGAIEILTGYGLEGDLPDAILSRVINNYMLPAFRQKDWDKGMTDGVNVLAEILNGRAPEDVMSSNGDLKLLGIFFLVFLLIPLIAMLITAYFANRCPKCKKRKLKRTNSIIVREGGHKFEKITLVCQNCGNIIVKKRRINDHSSGGSSGGGTIIIGGMPRGGSRGGSFGGGSFGGGGARGRF